MASEARVPTFINSAELAEICGVSIHCVHGWRHRNAGPPSYKIGGALRYRLDEVLEYFEAVRQSGDEG